MAGPRRLRIAFLVGTFPSVSETFILSQITGLLARGHQVDIYARRRGGNQVTHPDVERYRLLARTRYVGEYDAVQGRAARAARALAVLARAALTRPALLRRWVRHLRAHGPYASLNLLFTLAPFWAADYDIIHAHFGPVGTRFLFLKAWTRAKYLCSFYGYDVSSYVAKHGAGVYRDLFAAGDLFVPMTCQMRVRLEGLGCDPARIAVHRVGVDTSRFTPRASGRRADGAVHLLTVARLVEKKGLEYAIQAVAQAVRRHPQLRYQIVGEGPLEPSLRALIRELSLDAHVSLLGPQRSDIVAGLMADADVFLLPSVTAASGDQEGLPGVLVEAQASGMPVVSTRHSGIPELVQDGYSGFLVAERDVAALADRLCALIEDPEMRSRFGMCGRRIVEERFNLQRLNQRLADLYGRLLAGRPVPHDEDAADAAMPVEPRGLGRPDMTVILATRNRAAALAAALERLTRQETGGAFTYEVLVADNGSTDATAAVVRQAHPGTAARITYLSEPRPGKPFALNAAIAQACGTFLAFMDDDVAPAPQWLAALHRCFEETQADAVAGRVLPRWTAPRPAWLDDEAVRLLGLGCVDHGPARRRSADRLDCRWVGGNMAIRRSLIARVGLFDTRMLRGQDEEFYRRCLAQGAAIVYEPAAVAHHAVGAERMTPAYFRMWHDRAGYYRAYTLPWKATHAVTVMPMWRYGRLAGWAARWLVRALLRRPWWARFYAELRLREEWSVLRHRAALWPRWVRAVATGQVTGQDLAAVEAQA